MSIFSVRPVKGYKPGYPSKGFFRKSFVVAIPIKLFSLLVIGLLFFISVPGCGEQVVKTDGVPEVDFDVVNDNETVDDLGIPDTDSEATDLETSDFDELGGVAVPECLNDKDCDANYYCDLNTKTCVEKLSGDAVPECLTDEECDEGYYCDLTTYTCVEQLAGDPIPDQEISDSETNDETVAPDETEVPDEALSGIAPPEMKI